MGSSSTGIAAGMCSVASSTGVAMGISSLGAGLGFLIGAMRGGGLGFGGEGFGAGELGFTSVVLGLRLVFTACLAESASGGRASDCLRMWISTRRLAACPA